MSYSDVSECSHFVSSFKHCLSCHFKNFGEPRVIFHISNDLAAAAVSQ